MKKIILTDKQMRNILKMRTDNKYLKLKVKEYKRYIKELENRIDKLIGKIEKEAAK